MGLRALGARRTARPRARARYSKGFACADNDGPNWITTGPCGLASLTTMRSVLERGYVDLSQPEQSLLLRKPLAEDAGGLEHGGHEKFESTADPAYLDFKTWIEREAACRP